MTEFMNFVNMVTIVSDNQYLDPERQSETDDDDAHVSARRYALRLRADDEERLALRNTVQFLLESYNEWQEQDWTGGYIYHSNIFDIAEDRELQLANTRSMDEYEVPASPVDPEVADALVRVKATTEISEKECPICLGDIALDDTVVSASPACKHYMHDSCAKEWFLYGDFCAVCKHPVGDDRSKVGSQSTPQ
jgi:hypothetical protein